MTTTNPPCDGSSACPADTHIEGCFAGPTTTQFEYRSAVGWEEGEAVHYGHSSRVREDVDHDLELLKRDKGRFYPAAWVERRPYAPWERVS